MQTYKYSMRNSRKHFSFLLTYKLIRNTKYKTNDS